ncbi:MAG: hypothetical protein QOH88_536 [Verrucomicrobiota bacterium]|jgi:hypothetical protein
MARALHKEGCNQQILMKTKQTNHEVQESTYALLVRSEDKERSFFETVVYGLFILSAVAAIWQFAQQPINFPGSAMHHTAVMTQLTGVAGS